MLKPLLLVVILFSAVGTACSVAPPPDPDLRTDDWEENWHRSTRATDSGDHQQAISVAEAFLKKYPDNADGHLMVANAFAEAARAASDARRPEQFKAAATHYERALELTKNPIRRSLASLALERVYGVGELNDPPQEERFARIVLEDDSKSVAARGNLVEVLKREKKFEEAASLLKQATTTVDPSSPDYSRYVAMIEELVARTPNFPKENGRQLLADTASQIDQAIAKYGRTEKLLLSKGFVLRAQAEIDPEGPRAHTLMDESTRIFDEMDRLDK